MVNFLKNIIFAVILFSIPLVVSCGGSGGAADNELGADSTIDAVSSGQPHSFSVEDIEESLGGFYAMSTSISESSGDEGWVTIVDKSQDSILFFDQEQHFFRCLYDSLDVFEVTSLIGVFKTQETQQYCYYGTYEYEIIETKLHLILNIERFAGESSLLAGRQQILKLDISDRKTGEIPSFYSPYGVVLESEEKYKKYRYSQKKALRKYQSELLDLNLYYDEDAGLLIEGEVDGSLIDITGFYQFNSIYNQKYLHPDDDELVVGKVEGDGLISIGDDNTFFVCFVYEAGLVDSFNKSYIGFHGTWTYDPDETDSLVLSTLKTSYEGDSSIVNLPLEPDEQEISLRYFINTILIDRMSFSNSTAFADGMSKSDDFRFVDSKAYYQSCLDNLALDP